jgi:hypothetical protein
MGKHTRLETSAHHKRQCCDDCGWWSRPAGYPGGYFYCWDGFDRDVCPKCGGENLTEKIGQVITEHGREGWWFFRWETWRYTEFITKEAS